MNTPAPTPNPKLSPNFYLSEFTHSEAASRRGLSNAPSALALANLVRLAGALEWVRALLGGVPIAISSGYRNATVNVLVGGSLNSAHLTGLAADFCAPGFGTPLEVARAIEASSIEFDQLICEGTWVHLGLVRVAKGLPAPVARQQVLTAVFSRGAKTTYLPGLVGLVARAG